MEVLVNRKHLSAAVLALLLPAGGLAAQEREDRTLLDMNSMRAIINEASGERAMHHIMEFVPYVRVRPIEEYKGNFRESLAMMNFAKQYGYSTAVIESYPTTNLQFQATQAELWMVEPEVRKLFDLVDVPLSFGGGPQGELTAELVDIGLGQPFATTGRDFSGKFVLAGQNASRQGVSNAAGFINYSQLRPNDQPDMIMGGGGGGQGTTNWNVSPRVGRELAAILARGQKVVLKSVIKGESVPGEIELVHLTIAGDGSSKQSVAISCHLHEGYIKQGANDDTSGCALTLEVGRAYIRLVNEGKLPQAQADDPFPRGSGDQRHQRVPQRAPRNRQHHGGRPQFRHGRPAPLDQRELLGDPPHAGHLPQLPERRRAELRRVRRQHQPRAHPVPRQRLRFQPADRLAQRKPRSALLLDRQALRRQRTTWSTSTRASRRSCSSPGRIPTTTHRWTCPSSSTPPSSSGWRWSPSAP